MHQIKIVSTFVVMLILVTSCIESSTATSMPEDLTPVNTQAQTDTSSSDAEIAFYDQGSKEDILPNFRAWVEPVDDDPMPSILVECMGDESEVYSPTTGIILNNHCIIKTRDQMAVVVLEDSSSFFLNKNTVIQFNLSENAKEIIMKEGEAYFNITDQKGSTYKVKFGDSTLEVVGTEFDVNIHDKVMSVFMATGSVAHYVCSLWENNVCSEWGEVFENLFGTNMYTRTIGAMEWQKTEYSEDFQTGESPDSEFIRNARFLSDFYNGVVASGMSAYQQAAVMMGNLSGSTSHWDIPEEEYNQMANERNEQTASSLCENYPDNCFSPANMPTMSDSTVSQPSTSSGESDGSSGGTDSDTTSDAPTREFPPFDRSTCFVGYSNHFMCRAVEGYDDDNSEWDITRICQDYPNQEVCSWMP